MQTGVYHHLVRRWQTECENCTLLDEQQWIYDIRRKYLDLASSSQEYDWVRTLFYKRCKHLRYIIMLASSTAVAYLCPQETIFLLFSNSLRLWRGWYYLSTFVTLAGVPAALAVVVSGKSWLRRRIVRQMVAATLLLGFLTPVLLLFITLIWQWHRGMIDSLDWLAAFGSLPLCVLGLATGFVEVFPSGKPHRVHPLQINIFGDSGAFGTDTLKERVEKKFTEIAFGVCDTAHMDDDAFRDKEVENIQNTLFVRWREHIQESNDPLKALDTVLRNFGPTTSAADEDPRWMRVLFYKRHATTRYLAIIGLALIVLYVRLLVFDAPSKVGEDRWALWDHQILSGSVIALSVLVASRGWFASFLPLRILFGLGTLWGLKKVCVDALVAIFTILGYWSERWIFWGLLVVAPSLCLALVVLLCCVASEYFHPVPRCIVVKLRRWRTRFQERFVGEE